MDTLRLSGLLARFSQVRVGVIGDYCLDAYWMVDPSLAEVSYETGKPTLPVREQVYGLGGAGNIVANLAALGAGRIHAVGVRCEDLFGRELARLLEATGADTEGMVLARGPWSTPVYGKPHVSGVEQMRLDFGVLNRQEPETGARVVEVLERLLPSVHGVVVNQQLASSVLSPGVIQGVNRLADVYPDTVFVVDSRDRSDGFRGVTFRMNAHEAARVCGRSFPAEGRVPPEDAVRFARKIEKDTGKPCFVSLGPGGCVVCERGSARVVPGVPCREEIDPVGAGDTAVAALVCALAAGASPLEAAELSNLAAAVTVRKLRQTGTASPEEILELLSER